MIRKTGFADPENERMVRMRTLLFVCSGNTCRSPMAEAVANALIQNEPTLAKSWCATSAGISAYDGENMTSHARDALRCRGFEPGEHRARRLTWELLDSASMVLCMEHCHADYILTLYPEMSAKVFVLNSRAGLGEGRIRDPYMAPLPVYIDTLDEIVAAIAPLIKGLSEKGEAL